VSIDDAPTPGKRDETKGGDPAGPPPDLTLASNIPQDHVGVLRAGRDERAIRAERYPAHPVCVAGEVRELLPGAIQHPHEYFAVIAAGDNHVAVWTHPDRANVVIVPAQLPDRCASRSVPDPHLPVV